MTTTIWHNPRCSKSRQTLQLLRDRGIEPTIIDYQKPPPDIDELQRILKLLALEPRAIMRKGEKVYKELQLATADNEQLLKAMVAHPILIERPIVEANGKAALGRPPESVLEII